MKYNMQSNQFSDDNNMENQELSESLAENIDSFKTEMGESKDIKYHQFNFGKDNCVNACLIFIDGLVSDDIINKLILRPLLSNNTFCFDENNGIEELKSNVICVNDSNNITSIAELLDCCLSGRTVLIIDGQSTAIDISSEDWSKRSITEPISEPVVKGPREGFTEDFITNTSLLRRKLKTSSLHMKNMKIGRRTRTNVCIAYISDIADRRIIDMLISRLKGIKTDAVFEAGYIEQYIEDSPFSVFQTVGFSERPDVIAAKLLEGRVAIFIDGTPFVLTVPMLFWEGFQTAEDYYLRTFYASGLRILRYLSFVITILAPAVYVALTTFHQEFIPTALLFTVAQAREGVPFPAVFEAFILLFAFEVLREGGLRLPSPIGQAISIVGALIMGEAAVRAGFVGSTMVIVMALTAVSAFVNTKYADSASFLRLIFLVLAGILGGFGIAVGILAVLIHLASLESFGIPYLEGVAPLDTQSLKDIFIRAPLWNMEQRPKQIAQNDVKRHEFSNPPKIKRGGGKNEQ